ncbi:hypothetical protein LTR91_015264 [Friedmanniomyces endolithicus]|uniref:Uncharacterized protein n=1 Tax=Friedmanniomyces endolithicus TaxID=329885 RepID=A0AAN6KAH0_9PEZI|nr:hypothetical protein LTR94_001138 [Friedmanniomyces endolithicus]KAK0787676.1 hypothetical protein LTR75_012813 [Friedmanniomyces endolithicus]KAK0816469.1 hypothetical protein LTR59_000097 [Friedmanniomyces endolithicus]KAK0816659.1 hypothetical protein LTR38_002048 [Friedmanniomyces endolithicus]KAK0849451.1 hypothetical protein LTS02_013604 [Friedmanniomyces endolithicus]
MQPSFSNRVSVFHFTNRISSAKIRKYTIATERGMQDAGRASQSPSNSGALPIPAPQVLPASAVQAGTPAPTHAAPPGSASPPRATGDSQAAEAPVKKVKLKLTVKPQEPSPAIATQSIEPVAPTRPKREIRYRMRYDDNMVLDDESLRIHSPTSSDLSSPEPTPPPKKRKQTNSISKDYGDMANWYIAADEDDPNPTRANPPSKAAAKPRKRAPPRPRQPRQMPPQSHMQPAYQGPYHPQDPRMMPMQQQQQQQQRLAQAPVNYHPPPTVPPPKALANFGGVPARPSSPIVGKDKHRMSCEGTKGEANKGADRVETKKRKFDPPVDNLAVDSLLGAIGGDEDDSGEDEGMKEPHSLPAPTQDVSSNLDYCLNSVGTPDGPLSYGIQFIQNALKSWAYQRLQTQHSAHWQQQHGATWQQYLQSLDQQHQVPPQKKALGRPRKFAEGKEDRPQTTPLHYPKQHLIRIKADHTPEGVAVQAFQRVLESGCLRVNAALPPELTRALRILYMQIDHLINQNSKNEPQWHCMSYGAQIAANKSRVESWKEAQATAQMEMERQQQLSQQQLAQQMGMPGPSPQQTGVPSHAPQQMGVPNQSPQRMSMPNQSPQQMGMPNQSPQQTGMPDPAPQRMMMQTHSSVSIIPTQAQREHMLELEIRRNAQHAVQQPYNSQQHLNPLSLGARSAYSPTAYAPSAYSPSAYAPSPQSALGAARGNSFTAPAATPARRSSTPRSALSSAVATPNGSLATGSSEQQQHQQHLEKMTMYTPGVVPPTGMKFSFAPTDPQAVKVWGASAFPVAGLNGSSMPNRGPMSSGSPTEAQAQGRAVPVKAVGEAVVPSIESTAGRGSVATRLVNGDVDAEGDVKMGGMKEASQTGKKDVNGSGKTQEPVKQESTSTPTPVQGNGFTAVNIGGAVMPLGSPGVASAEGEEMAAKAKNGNGGVASVEKLNKGHGGANTPTTKQAVVDQ